MDDDAPVTADLAGDAPDVARKKRYGLSLEQLEASAHVPPADQVLEADSSPVPAADIVPPDAVERMKYLGYSY